MRRLSLRSLLLLASIVFAIFVVGAISLLTYIVVADGITSVSEDVSHRVAAGVEQVAGLQSRVASDQAQAEGLVGPAEQARARQLVIDNLRAIYGNRGPTEHADTVRVLEAARGVSLALEAPDRLVGARDLRPQELDGERLAELSVHGAVDRAHAAAPDHEADAIEGREHRPGREIFVRHESSQS